MDRSDEIRDDDYYEHADEARIDRTGEEDTADERTPAGDVLGIARANPPRDRVPSSDKSVGLTDTESDHAGSREVQRSPGATSIDMGAGGTGTDIERP